MAPPPVGRADRGEHIMTREGDRLIRRLDILTADGDAPRPWRREDREGRGRTGRPSSRSTLQAIPPSGHSAYSARATEAAAAGSGSRFTAKELAVIFPSASIRANVG
ncbi:hypothetical protein GCM10023196_074740 [Actinoallomurus vinaceus]|uniref:Uncharacterized protein n=1 Tax=Actinoallomurus vinaceus TaxID=1080074 RepID=A0ABP8UNF1_9ACTN